MKLPVCCSVRITLDSRKTMEQNAAEYFERAKKARKKAEGARKAVELAKRRMAEEAAGPAAKEEVQEAQPKRKKEWYESFRWFFSSDGLLCIGGRDATTNEAIIKKHADADDVVFHTDMAGSPFVVVKADGKEVPKATKEEAAQYAAVFSRAWKAGLGYLEVFSVKPEQLSKTAQAGEFMAKGAFMVRGSVTYYKPSMELAVGRLEDGRAMAGPPAAVLARCGRGFQVLQGNEKTSDVAKRIAKLLDLHPDDIIPLLPAGGVKLGREIRKQS